MIFWAGVSSDDVNIIVEHFPHRPRPAVKKSTVSVPGRNGDLVFLQNAYEDCIQSYDVYISAEAQGLARAAQGAAQWLYGPKGYQVLEDSYEPDIFRLARFDGPVDISNILNRFGRATIEFNCKPQRFIKAGQFAVDFEAPGALYNQYAFTALPLIQVYGSGAGTVTVDGITVTIKSLDGQLTLDCDTQNAYKALENKNAAIYAPVFPSLEPGENVISWTGGITRLEITPRWWTL